MHFEAEEELMRRSAYPGRMDHQDRHHELSLHLKAWDDRARRRDCPLSSAFVSRLEVWVQNHILGSDRGLSRFLLNGDNSAVTMRESAVAFQPVSCEGFADAQPSGRLFNRFTG
jgi:hemerythrin